MAEKSKEEKAFEEIYRGVEGVCKRNGVTFYRLKDSDNKTLWDKGVIYEGGLLLYEIEFGNSIFTGKKDVCWLDFIPKQNVHHIYSKLEEELHKINSLEKYIVKEK
jgi:hypothetical protein